MKLSIQILAFREENRIKPCIEQYYNIADEIIVAVSQKPWNGDLPPDSTYQLANTTQAQVFRGEWETEAIQRNFVMNQMGEDIDFVLIAPPDRFYTKEDLQNIRLFVDKLAEERTYSVFSLNYWKNFSTVIWPTYNLEAFLFPVLDSGGRKHEFKYANRLKNQSTHNPLVTGVTSHHISWIKTRQELIEKLSTFSHSHEVSSNWVETYWDNWEEGMTDFGVTVPGDFKGTIEYHLPNEILSSLDQRWVKQVHEENQ